jgi:hypothetical protein
MKLPLKTVMNRANKDIREEIRAAGLFQWQVAEALGISELWFTKKMRYEFSEEDKAEVRKAIAKLSTDSERRESGE